MQIIDNREKEMVSFSEVEVSEEFMHSGRLYMRTEHTSYCNAVDLRSGDLRYFPDEEYVSIVSAIITIQP